MSKIIKYILLLLFLQAVAFSQSTIAGAEYFIDMDPGEGNGISLTASDGSFDSGTENVNFDVTIDDLSLGAHWIYVRFHDSDGNWGNPRAEMFTISNPVQGLHIAEAEYFIDIDPGEGNGTPLQTTDDTFDENIEELIGSQIINTNITLGEHQLYIRGKSSDGVWGQAAIETIMIDNEETTLPEIEIINLSSNPVGTIDSLLITWNATDNWLLDSAFVDVLFSDEMVRVDTTMAGVGQSTIAIPDSSLESFQLIVTVWDYNHNEARDTSEVITVFDNTNPQVIVLTPSTETSIPEYEELSVTWNASDNIEMDSVSVYFSNGGEFEFEGKLYYEDAFSFTIPFGVTDSARIKLIAQDFYGNTGEGFSEYFSITDNTPPTVELQTPVNTVLGTGNDLTIAWTATDNVEGLLIDLSYSVNSGDFVEIASNEENDGEFHWIVPNEPTDDLKLRAVATDQVGLSDTSWVTDLSIIIVYPYIVFITPDDPLLPLRDSEITIQFSQQLDSTTITNENIRLQSNYTDVTNPLLNWYKTEKTLRISFTNGLASADSIFIELEGSNITNMFGYPLDANNDGDVGETIVLNFATQLLADYDTTGVIDFYDLNQFVSSWYAGDYAYELGPAIGTVPHLIPTYDNQFDIEDMATFLRMWNWSFDFVQPLTRELIGSGDPSEFRFEDNHLIMALSDSVESFTGIRVSISMPNPAIKFNSELEEQFTFSLVRDWEDKNITEINIARINPEKVIQNIELGNIAGNRDKINIDYSYEVLGLANRILSRGSGSIEYIPIPDAVVLFPAYPNPFNPATTLEFGLPDEQNVSVVVYDILGREVAVLADKMYPAGYHKLVWYANQQASGMYFVQLNSGKLIKTKKIVLLK